MQLESLKEIHKPCCEKSNVKNILLLSHQRYHHSGSLHDERLMFVTAQHL